MTDARIGAIAAEVMGPPNVDANIGAIAVEVVGEPDVSANIGAIAVEVMGVLRTEAMVAAVYLEVMGVLAPNNYEGSVADIWHGQYTDQALALWDAAHPGEDARPSVADLAKVTLKNTNPATEGTLADIVKKDNVPLKNYPGQIGVPHWLDVL